MSNWNSDGLGHLRAGPLHNPIPRDEPEYLEDETGGMILCYECDEWAEGYHQETPMCGAHLKDAFLWDQADNMNQIGWEE